jgi:hypothetical protein
MNPTQVPNDSNFHPSLISTSHLSTSHQQYDNAGVSTQPIPYYQVPCTSSSNFSNLKEYSFFYNTPNDPQIYKRN